MDTETAEVVERIYARIDALEMSLRAEIRGESTTLRAEIRGESTTLRGEMSSMRDDLRAEIRESFTEAKRYALVLHESVRDDIRMVAEAVATVSTKLDSLQR